MKNKDLLAENLEKTGNVIESLKKKSYKPKPARLAEIQKNNGKMRTLSIYCYEDKLVQEALCVIGYFTLDFMVVVVSLKKAFLM